MTGSTCIPSAETAAGDTGALTAGGKKPRAPDKTVRVIAEAHHAATTCAREARTDRKTIVSQAILVYCARPEVPADLSLLIERTNRVTLLLLDKIEQACEGETLELEVVRALGPLAVKFIHEIPRLSALREKSSTSEHIPFDWRDEDDEAEESAEK